MKLSNSNQSLNATSSCFPLPSVYTKWGDGEREKERTNERPGRTSIVCTSTISCGNEEYRRRRKRKKHITTPQTTDCVSEKESERENQRKRKEKKPERERKRVMASLHCISSSERVCGDDDDDKTSSSSNSTLFSVTFLQIEVNYEL